MREFWLTSGGFALGVGVASYISNHSFGGHTVWCLIGGVLLIICGLTMRK